MASQAPTSNPQIKFIVPNPRSNLKHVQESEQVKDKDLTSVQANDKVNHSPSLPNHLSFLPPPNPPFDPVMVPLNHHNSNPGVFQPPLYPMHPSLSRNQEVF